jgi:hypothetical protein
MNDETIVNMVLKCVNNYYCTYYEKCVSSNKKCIKNHNNSKLHKKLQENTHIFKCFCIGNLTQPRALC